MHDNPLVSVLINNYNYGRFLAKAIDSVLHQTYTYIEFLVVDDGSTDNSREVIAGYGDQIIPVLKENGGQASAFNAGFAASHGEIICFLDSDDVFMPEKVAKVVTVFKSYKDISWCFHRLKMLDLDTGAVLAVSPGFSSGVYDFRSSMRKRRRARLPLPAPGTSGLCFARWLLQQILPMPEGEDVTISDKYLQCTGLALSKGFFLDEQLTIKSIHGNNRFSLHAAQSLTAKINILTAYWLRRKLPKLATYANHLLASGIGVSWLVGGVDMKYKKIINHYLSSFTLLEKSKIRVMVFAYFLWYQVKSVLSKAKG